MSPLLQTSIESTLESYYDSLQAGAALLIAEKDTLVFQKELGLADILHNQKITPETNFRMASVSKQFTAMCISLLEQRGLLSYDDNLLHFFPEFCPIGARVKLRHLLTHTSGLLDYENFVGRSISIQVSDVEVLQIMASRNKTYFEPGTAFRYSNTGFVLLALIVEKVSGFPYAAFLHHHIFKPLGMDHTVLYEQGINIASRAMGYARNEHDKLIFADQGVCTATKGDGCIYTSLQDYQKWQQALCREGKFSIIPLLEAVNAPVDDQNGWLYGMGWFFSKRADGTYELYHTGNTTGFSHLVIMYPEREALIAYFSNIADNPHLLQDFLQALQAYPELAPQSDLVNALGELTR